ncbi:nucleotidyltransferase domain-containing protein [Pyrobaculum sp.]|uniref:nucleotidyltransferase domain-containing protein n=1 Tax=Pyrobaculum sp. TaxID=2004705 RepID=UPI00317AE9D0
MLNWGVERVRAIKEWRAIAERICEEVRRYLPDAKVYVFGSVARGNWAADSDIDVLIISERAPDDALERARIAVAVKEALGRLAPVELHFATPKQYAEWYAKFIDVSVKIC